MYDQTLVRSNRAEAGERKKERSGNVLVNIIIAQKEMTVFTFENVHL